METNMKGLYALRKLRQELQDDAGLEFPQAIHTEMLVLYNVCKCLELNLLQCKAVLGEIGWRYIHTYLTAQVTIKERMHYP
jgi:hypothetical protein